MAFNSSPVTSSAGSYFSYLTSGCPNDAPQFVGKGFDRLRSTRPGISFSDRKAAKDLFLELGRGLTPDGKQIQKQNGKHRTGIDCVWSAPKWVSTLMAISTHEQRAEIQAAWDEHVLMMFERLEAKATLCRPQAEDQPEHCTKRQGPKTERTTGELIGFIARHHTARPTPETENAGRHPDPHLHTHVFLFNMAWSHGKWRAIDDYGLKNPHRGLAGQIAIESEGDLARRLENLGYRPEYFQDRRGRFHTKLEKLDTLNSFFSSNERRVEDERESYMLEHGRLPTPEQLRRRMRFTRTSKTKAEQTVDWERIVAGAVEAGIEVPRIDTQSPLSRMPLSVRKRELVQRLYAANGLCGEADDACFGRKELDLAVARCAVGLGMTLEEQDAFREELTAQLVVVDPDPKSKRHWTTPKNLKNEWSIFHRLEEVNAIAHPVLSEKEIEMAIANWETDQGIKLDDEQRAVVIAAFESGLLFIEGFGGTGKTRAMACASAILRQYQLADKIVAISTARDTALRTGVKLSAERMDSIESFIQGVRKGKIKPTERTVIFLDEAVMVDNDRMAELLKYSGKARLICIGDRKQLACIGAGGWYADAVAKYGVHTLTKVWRQTDPRDVAALFDLRSGRALEMISYLQGRDRLHIADTPEEALGQIVDAVIADRNAGYGVNDIKIVTDGANTLIDAGNRLIQIDRLNRGELTGEGYKMTAEQTGRSWMLYAGDEVSFCASYYDPDTSVYLPNGLRARVLEIDHAKNVVTIAWARDGKENVTALNVAHRTFEQFLTPDYMIHACRLQGGEAPIIRVMPGCGTTSLQSGYSQTSRCITEVHVYLDRITHGGVEGNINPVDMLVKRWTDNRAKVSARTRMSWFAKHREQKIEAHLDRGPTRPLYDSPAEHKPWLEQTRQKRRWEVDKKGITRGLV